MLSVNKTKIEKEAENKIILSLFFSGEHPKDVLLHSYILSLFQRRFYEVAE